MRAEPEWPSRRCASCDRRRPRAAFADGWARRCDECRADLERCSACGEPTAGGDRSAYWRRTCGRSECVDAAVRGASAQALSERWACWRAGPGRRKRCPACLVDKPRDEEHFAVLVRDPAGAPRRYDGWCRPCRRAYQRDRYAHDERRRASTLARAAAYKQRRRQLAESDPAEARRQAEAKARYNAAQRRRRAGEFVPDGRRTAHDVPQGPRGGARLPVAPLLAVVERLVSEDHDDNAERVCERLGLSDRTLRDWRSGRRTLVQLVTVDRVLLELGLHAWDVWDGEDAECLAA